MRGKFLTAPAGLLICILFFLPWVTVSCSGDDLGELTGYQLSLGEEDVSSDEFTPDPLLLVIPVTGLLAILASILLFVRPDKSRIVGGVLLFMAMAAITIPLVRGIQLQNAYSNATYEVLLRPSLWGTMVGLLGVFAGGVIDLIRAPAIRGQRQQQAASISSSSPPYNLGGHTILEEDLPQQPKSFPGTGGATMLEEDLFKPQSSRKGNYAPFDPQTRDAPNTNETIMDDDLPAGMQGVFGSNETIMDEDIDLPRRAQAPQTRPYEDLAGGRARPPVERTELLPPEPRLVATAVILNGPHQNERIPINETARIGRIPGNEIILDDTAVSTHHATILQQNDTFILKDENSTNGVFIFMSTDNRWERVQQTELRNGSQIKIGRIMLQIEIRWNR
jgi:hypothetical protein